MAGQEWNDKDNMTVLRSADWQDDLALIVHAAREAGKVAHGFFRRSPEVWWKNGGRSPVSAADFAANETLENLLQPMPLGRKLYLFLRNNWRKLRTGSGCCGNHGEPGC